MCKYICKILGCLHDHILLFILRVVPLKQWFKSKKWCISDNPWLTSIPIYHITMEKNIPGHNLLLPGLAFWRMAPWKLSKTSYVDDICFQFGGGLRAPFPQRIWKKLSIKETESLPLNQLSQVSIVSAVSKIPKGMLNKEIYQFYGGMFHIWRNVIKNFHFQEAVSNIQLPTSLIE